MGNFSAGIYSAPALLVLKINVFLNLISLNLIPKLNHKLKKILIRILINFLSALGSFHL